MVEHIRALYGPHFAIADRANAVAMRALPLLEPPKTDNARLVAAVLFGLVWMGGIVGSIGTAFHNGAVENIGTVSSLILPSDGLWRGAV